MGIFKPVAVVGAILAAVVSLKSCSEAFFEKSGQEDTEFTERLGENLVDDTVGVFKGVYKGGEKLVETIGEKIEEEEYGDTEAGKGVKAVISEGKQLFDKISNGGADCSTEEGYAKDYNKCKDRDYPSGVHETPSNE